MNECLPHAIKCPGKGNAAVTFKMFYRHMFQGPHRLLAEISNKVRLGTTNEDGFDIIVACAAHKLVQDMRAATAVHREWRGGLVWSKRIPPQARP